jgi:hypothetical protein
MPALRARRPLAALALSGLVSVVVTAFTPSVALAVVPAAPVALPSAIEVMPPYQPQTICDPVVKSGTLALGTLLTKTYAGTSVIDYTRPCGSDTSEHYDGRAIDWGVDHRVDKQRAQGKAFLQWLFATDSHGNTYANVRRLGVMYVIWNSKIWGAWDHTWQPYACSGATACHIDHMHLSLDWSGALERTSFWTGVASTPMAPPKFVYRSTSWSEHVQVGSQAAHVTTPFRVKGGLTYRFTVSGTYHYDGTKAHRADAECSTTDGTTWSPVAPGQTSDNAVLDLSVNGHHSWHPTAGSGCNTSTHTYTRRITFPSTTVLTFAVNDATHGNDSGALSVTVQRLA